MSQFLVHSIGRVPPSSMPPAPTVWPESPLAISAGSSYPVLATVKVSTARPAVKVGSSKTAY